MSLRLIGDIRFEKAFSSPSLSGVVVSRSSEYCPGDIFTPETDFKTRELAIYAIDDIDASPSPAHPSHRHASRPLSPIYHRTKPSTTGDVSDKLKNMTVTLPEDVPTPKLIVGASCKFPAKKSKDQLKAIKKEPVPRPAAHSIQHQLPTKKRAPNCLRGSKFSTSRTSQPKPLVPNNRNNGQGNNHIGPEESLAAALAAVSTASLPKDRTGILGDLSSSSTVSDDDAPSHLIHGRMMGWKLTSPDRRKELLHLLHESSDGGSHEESNEEYMTEEEYKEYLRVVKRQTQAYEESINRLTYKQRKNFKASQTHVEKRRREIKTGVSSHDFRSSLRQRPLSPSVHHAVDPFAEVEVSVRSRRGRTPAASVAREMRCRDNTEKSSQEKSSSIDSANDTTGVAGMAVGWGFAPSGAPELKAPVPPFQTCVRSPRSLLNPADRMELLEHAKSVEKTTQVSASDALAVADIANSQKPAFMHQDLPQSPEARIKDAASAVEPYLRKVATRGELRISDCI
mmetsp:Transcript_515/g.912  ORF Transcript_515/g.912 Transcript_515/m.912 type:complete len:511 (+) Transcript_515:152-1684(+)|eukprot:CAMPEP_0185033870 /NCGR_PEP_ID=MMETSP1103-20130426/23248_1 /TAXON_ID=36769 /ORGANISM="Paraphysomonas bandaiensis, Strain Caron Lab Isolate" /LENGTH=510 /DNA_ID=CAMNT_0027570297 /DNA_START=105 /DNA_END=1637 /DNA_ORIENTATION=-